jgi:hypothetical protein
VALGIYHNPGIWFGDNPYRLPVATLPAADEIIRQVNVEDIGLAVTRDGMFIFDFSKWTHAELQKNQIIDVDRRVQQLEIINSFFFCLYCAIATRGLVFPYQRWHIPIMRASHSNLLSTDGQGYGSAGLSDDFQLVLSRRRDIRQDRFISSPNVLKEKVLDIAIDLFSALWPNRDEKTFTFVDLMLAAHVAHFNLRYAEALSTSWLISETLISMLWSDYINQNRQRNDEVFISGKRAENLAEGRNYSASVQIEVLSLLNEIPYQTYQALTSARKARNDWIHGLEHVTVEQSDKAIVIAEELFRDRYGLNSTLPPNRGLTFVSGGEMTAEVPESIKANIREVLAEKERIYHDGLDKELRDALGDRCRGFSTHGNVIRVHLLKEVESEYDAKVQAIIEAHDPAFLSIDDKHALLAGEFKFDGPQDLPHIIGNGKDEAVVTIRLPHTKKTEITLLCNRQPHLLTLKQGVVDFRISSDKRPKTIKISVRDHPCKPLKIKVIPPDN